MKMNKAGKNVLLDYVRAIACILIVLYHYTQRYNELFQNSINWNFRVPWGYMAVATFFMLSGYLAVIKDESNTKLWKYVKRRLIRIYPAYWVAIPLTFAVTYFWLPARSISIEAALFNFTMLESFVGVDLVDGAYWTLANELIFYCFIAFVVVVLKKRDELPTFLFVWVLFLIVFHFVARDTLIFAAIGKIIAKKYGHMFAVGASLFFLINNFGTRKDKIISSILLIFAICYQKLTFGLGYTLYFLTSLVIISTCILVSEKGIVLHKTVRQILHPLETIAAISYPLYLLHQNIGYAVMENLRPVITDSEWIIILPCILVGVIAYLIHRFVEIPVTNRYRPFG